MFDDSGLSLSASDPNPTIDQIDDGGSSADFSSTLSSTMQWGTEIAAAVTAGSSPVRTSGGPLPSATVKANPTTKVLMLALGVAAAVAVVYYVS